MTAHSTRRRRNLASDRSMIGVSDFKNSAHVHTDHTMRQAIAQQAAALIAEGLDDYHAAKIKAAKALGVGDKKDLPNNHEIEAALIEHHALFASDSQPAALLALREAAIRTMQWLERFQPWLTGAVLTGTANEYSAIELELVGIDVKQFELFLINEDVVFEIHVAHTSKSRTHSFKSQQQVDYRYEITFDDAPVEITLFDSHTVRQAKYPQESIKHDRALLLEAMQRFNL
jgi:hypothetical protein